MTKSTLTTSSGRALEILNEQFGGAFIWHNSLDLEDRLDTAILSADGNTSTVAVAEGIGVADSESLHSSIGQMRKSGLSLVFTSHAVANSHDEKGFLGFPLDNGNWVCLTISHNFAKDWEEIQTLTLCADIDAMLERQTSHVQWLINEHLDPIIEMSRDIGKMLKHTKLTQQQSQRVVNGMREAIIGKTEGLVETVTKESRAHLEPATNTNSLEIM